MMTRTLGKVCERRVLASCCLAIACSTAGAGSVRQLADGRYQVECESSLRECLARAEARCDISGYQVLSAVEAKRRVGVPPVQSEYMESRAIFVCGGNDAAPQAVSVSPSPSPPAPTQALTNSCLPGASQACVGPGGCSGGQTCSPDGKSLSPCDCGPASPPGPPPASIAPRPRIDPQLSEGSTRE